MNYGAMMSVGLIIISVIQNIFNAEESSIIQMLNYFLIIMIIFIGTKKLRDSHFNGFISYGKAFTSGFLISFFASFIFSFYIYINLTFIDINGIEKILQLMEQQLIMQGNADEQVETIMNLYEKIISPFTMSLGSIFAYTFLGTIFSLIISIFVKKIDSNPFSNITNNNTEI
jgi:hypothetical protein